MKQPPHFHQSSSYTNINNIFEHFEDSNLDYPPGLDHHMSSYHTPHFSSKSHPQVISHLHFQDLLASDDQILNNMKAEDDFSPA
jgi:hypothetical protein